MAVVKIRHMNTEGGEDDNGPTYRLVYWVTTDDRKDGPFIVRQAVPWIRGDAYIMGNEYDPLARVLSISERPLSSAHYRDWEVTVNFGVRENQNDDPLMEPIKESWGNNTKARKFTNDRNGSPLLDGSGVPLLLSTGGITEDDLLPTVSYSFNIPVWPHAIALAVRNATNSVPWKLFGAKTVKITGMTGERQFHPKYGIYYSAALNFGVDPDGVQPFDARKSFWYKDGSERKRFMEGDPLGGSSSGLGWPSAQPHLVDANGEPTNIAIKQIWELRPQLDFNVLFGFL